MSQNKHQAGELCPLCEEKLLQAHPYMVSWFHDIKKKYLNTHISWAYRGKEDQERFFEDGKTKLHWPYSAHNHIDHSGNPASLALDLFQEDEDGVARWEMAFFRKLDQDNKADHLPIFWGGNWKSLGDGDHFELQFPKETLAA